MKVIKTQDFQPSGRRIEGDGSIVVRPVSQVVVTMDMGEVAKLLVDLNELDSSRINEKTEMLIAMLKGTRRGSK